MPPPDIQNELRSFSEFGRSTEVREFEINGRRIPVYINEFWTSKQRAAHSLHEISYRACFKPQLPRFFIERFSQPGDLVYDPFMGRGTTLLEAALLNRQVIGCDVNPLSRILIQPRLKPPTLDAIRERLGAIELSKPSIEIDTNLLHFYHFETLSEITRLKDYFLRRERSGELDVTDQWIRMVATNRLTGHSSGFFSVYTLPPNQAVSVKRQKIINQKRSQIPSKRDVKGIILKKSKSLMKDLSCSRRHQLHANNRRPKLITGNCAEKLGIQAKTVDLIVTSPPFLDVVNYRQDNWLRCWFNGFDSDSLPIWQMRKSEDWIRVMKLVFIRLERMLSADGHIAFEVGEVRGGKLPMETLIAEATKNTNLKVEWILINAQNFTKTANCWGVSNASKGTNTNRVLVLKKSRDKKADSD